MDTNRFFADNQSECDQSERSFFGRGSESQSSFATSWTRTELLSLHRHLQSPTVHVRYLKDAFPTKSENDIKQYMAMAQEIRAREMSANQFVDSVLATTYSPRDDVSDLFVSTKPRAIERSLYETSQHAIGSEHVHAPQSYVPPHQNTSSKRRASQRGQTEASGMAHSELKGVSKRKPPKPVIIRVGIRQHGLKVSAFIHNQTAMPGQLQPNPAVTTNFNRLRSALSSDKARLHCYCEWVYSSIDSAYLSINEFEQTIQRNGIQYSPIMSKRTWSFIRPELGCSRRFSAAYLDQERKSLAETRVEIQQFALESKASNHYGNAYSLPSVSVGQCVQAFHPVVKSLHSGIILTMKESMCQVYFDQPDLGTHWFADNQLLILSESRKQVHKGEADTNDSNFAGHHHPSRDASRLHPQLHNYTNQSMDGNTDPSILSHVSMLLNRKRKILGDMKRLNDQAEEEKASEMETPNATTALPEVKEQMKDLVSQLYPINEPLSQYAPTLNFQEGIATHRSFYTQRDIQRPSSPATENLSLKLSSSHTDNMVDSTLTFLTMSDENLTHIINEEQRRVVGDLTKPIIYLLHLLHSAHYDPNQVWVVFEREWKIIEQVYPHHGKIIGEIRDKIWRLREYIFPK